MGYAKSSFEGKPEVSRDMAEQEVSASREEVEQFVGKLRDFHNSLSTSEQAMLDTVLAQAQGETGGYGGFRRERPEAAWNELVGNLIDEDTQGFGMKRG
jgi:hypothetical protein